MGNEAVGNGNRREEKDGTVGEEKCHGCWAPAHGPHARDAAERREGVWGGSDIQTGEDPPYMTVTLTVRKHRWTGII